MARITEKGRPPDDADDWRGRSGTSATAFGAEAP
ncbi:MAG: hypothetical protein DCF30_00640 [Hyphomicrobiales bacterium]|nr:MAG: hypothetical protein DCF30_00640 [Hyphomicrobiales bacterium]